MFFSLCFLARDNVVFLQRWFNKFPQYRKNNLFLTGESYAGIFYLTTLINILTFLSYRSLFVSYYFDMLITGHYVPQLAKLMLELNKKKQLFNLKGVAVSMT